MATVADVNGEPALVVAVTGVPTGIVAVVLDEAGAAVRLLWSAPPASWGQVPVQPERRQPMDE